MIEARYVLWLCWCSRLLILFNAHHQLQINAYVQCGKLKGAYLIAIRAKLVDEVRKISDIAFKAGQLPVRDICEKWLLSNAQRWLNQNCFDLNSWTNDMHHNMICTVAFYNRCDIIQHKPTQRANLKMHTNCSRVQHRQLGSKPWHALIMSPHASTNSTTDEAIIKDRSGQVSCPWE